MIKDIDSTEEFLKVANVETIQMTNTTIVNLTRPLMSVDSPGLKMVVDLKEVMVANLASVPLILFRHTSDSFLRSLSLSVRDSVFSQVSSAFKF